MENDNLYQDRKNNYIDKRDRKIDKYRSRAKNATAKAEQHRQTADDAVAGIPFGQPIVGDRVHRKRHRAAIDKCQNHMTKTLEEQDKAAYYFEKAMAAENNSSISSDDPDAIQLLKEKITALKSKQDFMKKANREFKKWEVDKSYKIQLTDEEKQAMLTAVSRMPSYEHQPYPGYSLTSVNNKIKEAEKRITGLEKFEKIYSTDQYKIDGIPECSFQKSKVDNRFKIFPPKKDRSFALGLPAIFKRHGFHWSPTNECYQRQLSGIGYVETLIIEALKGVRWKK